MRMSRGCSQKEEAAKALSFSEKTEVRSSAKSNAKGAFASTVCTANAFDRSALVLMRGLVPADTPWPVLTLSILATTTRARYFGTVLGY